MFTTKLLFWENVDKFKRHVYSANEKNKNTVTGSGYKKWIWFEELAFIDQFVKERM